MHIVRRIRPASATHQLSIGKIAVLPRMFSDGELDMLLAQDSIRYHHDDEGHVSTHKPLKLPWVAHRIWPHARLLDLEGDRPLRVDERMKLYRLEPGTGIVPPHTDEDFDGPMGSRALYSVLVYLNDGYEGGETVFNGIDFAPHGLAGSGLLFRHAMLHECLAVRSGVKFVLKTDLFVL